MHGDIVVVVVVTVGVDCPPPRHGVLQFPIKVIYKSGGWGIVFCFSPPFKR